MLGKSELKRVVSADLESSASYDARQRRERAADPGLERARLDEATLLASGPTAARSTTTKLEVVGRRQDEALGRLMKAQKRDAQKRTKAVARVLSAAVDSRVKGIRGLAGGHGLLPPPTAIEKPFLIWAYQESSEILIDEAIVAGGSWAKVRALGDKHQGQHDARAFHLTFFFLWENPRPDYAVIRASSFVLFSGYASVTADAAKVHYGPDVDPVTHQPVAHWTQQGGSARAAVGTYITARPWWEQPPSELLLTQLPVLDLSASGVGGADADTQFVGQGFALDGASGFFAVPPSGSVVFEVTVELTYNIRNATVDLDFATGPWQITCPYVIVDVLTGP